MPSPDILCAVALAAWLLVAVWFDVRQRRIPNLLVANGISTAPGNAAAIVDFFADALFAKALTGAERQAAIDFLNTDNSGVVSAYNNTRIRDVVGFLLGYPQFQEQ